MSMHVDGTRGDRSENERFAGTEAIGPEARVIGLTNKSQLLKGVRAHWVVRDRYTWCRTVSPYTASTSIQNFTLRPILILNISHSEISHQKILLFD